LQNTNLSVDCKRNSCPPLNCDPRLAFKEKMTDCCKRCPEPKPVTPEPAPALLPKVESEHGHDQGIDEEKMSDSEYRYIHQTSLSSWQPTNMYDSKDTSRSPIIGQCP
jgi:hypothetical protein